MTNTVDRFFAAVSILTGEGSVKQRLIRAYRENLDNVDAEELPEDLRERFVETSKRVHSVAPLNGEGRVCASVRKMSAQDASDCAKELLLIYTGMLGAHGDANGTDEEADPTTPAAPFLVKSASA